MDGTIFIEAEKSFREASDENQAIFERSLDSYVQLLIEKMTSKQMKCFGRSIMFKVRDGTGPSDCVNMRVKYGQIDSRINYGAGHLDNFSEVIDIQYYSLWF